jgi:hypothetical protein
MDATFMADVAIAMQASADVPIFRCLAINFFSNRVVPARERSLDTGLWVRSCDVDLLVMYITASVACGRRGMSVVRRRFGEISNAPGSFGHGAGAQLDVVGHDVADAETWVGSARVGGPFSGAMRSTANSSY